MSLNNLFSRTRLSEPFNVWKVKHRVHYKDDDVVQEENNQITTDSGEGGVSKPKIIPKSSSLAKLYIPRNRIDDRQLSPPTTSSATANATTVIRTARSPCDCCGHHNIPIMSHLPVSPLARSQNNLEMVETTSARQALLPAPAPPTGSSMRHEDSSSSLGPLTSLQISRRPSIMLQEILTTRFNGAKKDAKNGQPPRHPKNVGSLTDTANGSSWTMDVGSKSLQAKQSKDKNRRTGNDAISTALSATYCKLLVLLGVCLPITEVISDQIPTYVYQGFYVYLYSGSILFVIFLYITAFRHRTIFNALKNFHEQNNNVHLKHKVHHFGSFYLRVGAIAFAIGTMVYSGLEFGQFFELNGHPGCRDVFVAITPICRMVLCIVQVQFIFLNTTYLDMARHKVTSRFGLMHMVATNLCEWLYVLVEETKHEIFHIGMHGEEDEAALTGGKHGGVDWTAINATMNTHMNHVVDAIKGVTASVASTVASKTNQLLTANVTTTLATPTNFNANHSTDHAQHIVGCTRTNIMGALVQEVSPFLFPCTIEYSLICAVILYEMWKTVKSIPDIDRTRKHSIKPTVQKPAHHFSVDCSQSHKGLFFGILIIVMTIISMIMYFVLYMQPGFELIATQEVTLWETVMYFCCALAIVVGMILMRDLKYVNVSTDDHHSMELDNMLLVVAQTGVYLYGMFSILGSYFSKWDTVPDRVEGIVAEVFGLAQTSLQTMFILHSSHRRCKGAKQQRRKPGREIITFLLVANIAIWFVNTLIKGRAVFRETHLEFFGVWGWTIITHVSMPLAIFYRFHSTICLFEVWKVTYKAKAH